MNRVEWSKYPWRLAILATVMWTVLLVLISVLLMGYMGWRYLNQVADQAQTTPQNLVAELRTGLTQAETAQISDPFILLVLGTDEAPNRQDAPVLTDTILYVSMAHSGEIHLLSLPRDLWSQAYQTKINALYQYSRERDSENPEVFVNTALTELTGITPDATLVLSPKDLADSIDALGGIEVRVAQSFEDTRFPRDDVDLTSTNPAELYQTIRFEAGTERMSGVRAQQYVRSRMSQDEAVGNDLDRTLRQQAVVSGLIATIRSHQTYTSPQRVGQLWYLYTTRYRSELPLPTVLALGTSLLENRDMLSLTQHTLSVYPDDPEGIITHPPIWTTQNQWVYTVRDTAQFQEFVQTSLSVL